LETGISNVGGGAGEEHSISTPMHIIVGFIIIGAGICRQVNQVFVNRSFFPSAQSYNLIFLAAGLVSLVSIVLALLRKKGSISNTKSAPKEKVNKPGSK
jgi:hypothetical protein